ncbi:MAG: hypothetical protein ACI8W3_001779 [Myxococcota bacterium]|jgi:hypothetical protein
MNWDAVGAIGEVLGALTVVATLFYLSSQIRQNAHALNRSNEYARAASIHESNSHFSQVFAQLAQDAVLASIYHRALAGEPLDETETVRFQAFVNTFFAWFETLVIQARTQLSFADLDEGGPDYVVASMTPYFIRLLRTNAGSEWWNSDAQHYYSPSFRAAIDNAIMEEEASPLAV